MPSVGDRRHGLAPFLRRATVGVAALALAAGACGSSGDAPALVPTTTGAPSTVPITQVDLAKSEMVPSDAPTLVLATGAGVSRWDAADGPVVVHEIDDEVRHAVDDGGGGVVALTVDDQLLASLNRWPQEGPPVLLRSQGGLALHDATQRNDETAVVITYSPIDVAEPSQVLDLLDLATTSARTVGAVGDAESGVVSVAASADGFAVTQVQQDCTQVLVFDDTNEPVTGWVVPPIICDESSAPAYSAVAWADDGSLLAVARPGPNGSVLVAGHGDEPLRELTFDEPHGEITSLDADAHHIVATTDATTLLIDPVSLQWVDLGVSAHSVSVVDTQ